MSAFHATISECCAFSKMFLCSSQATSARCNEVRFN